MRRKILKQNNNLGICVPTHDPDLMNNNLLPSLKNLDSIDPDRTQFFLLFQPPWTTVQINSATKKINDLGFSIVWDYLDWKKKHKIPSVLSIRAICAEMDTGFSDVFVHLDHDVVFTDGQTTKIKKSGGQRYLEVLDYFFRHDKCGLVQARGFLGGFNKGCIIEPKWGQTYCLSKGMFFVNLSKHGCEYNLVPKNMIADWIEGSFEEPLFCFEVMSYGLYPAVVRNMAINHKASVATDAKGNIRDSMKGTVLSEELSLSDNGCLALIDKRYGPFNIKDHARQRTPVGLYSQYLKSGGPDFVNDNEIFKSLVEDY